MYTVLFDIDGTLILTGGAGMKAFAETFRDVFGIEEFTSEVAFAGRSDRAIVEELMTNHGIEVSPSNWELFTANYTGRLGETLSQCEGMVLPGVHQLLDELAALEHVAVGLLTGNIAVGARAKLSHYGLFERFAFGGYGDNWTHRNEIAVDAMRVARDYLHSISNGTLHEPSGVMVLGDTVADVECARAIDAYAVAVATGSCTPAELAAAEPDLLLTDLSDCRELLEQVNAKPSQL